MTELIRRRDGWQPGYWNTASSLHSHINSPSELGRGRFHELGGFDAATWVFSACVTNILDHDASLRRVGAHANPTGMYTDVANIDEPAGRGVLRIGIEPDSHRMVGVYAQLIAGESAPQLLMTVSVALGGTPSSRERGLITVHNHLPDVPRWQTRTGVHVGRRQGHRYGDGAARDAGELLSQRLQEAFPGLAAAIERAAVRRARQFQRAA